jgi:hypothetical protein
MWSWVPWDLGLRITVLAKPSSILAVSQDEHIIGVGKEYGRKDGRR